MHETTGKVRIAHAARAMQYPYPGGTNMTKNKKETEAKEIKLDVKKLRTGVRAGGWCAVAL